MAVQAQFGGLLPDRLPPYGGGGGGLADEQMRALREYGALLSAAAGNKGYQYNRAAGVVSAAQSELTCNGGGAALPSRKRGRGDDFDFEQYVTSSSAKLLPIPGMQKVAYAQYATSPAAMEGRMVDCTTASTSGRPATAAPSAAEDALVAELCRQDAEIDALVRAEWDRLRAGLEQARKRQRQAVARAAASCAAHALREKEAELDAARRRAAGLEERLRQAAAESQAWCGLARRNEAAAAGLRATLDAVLLRCAGVASATARQPAAEEGSGESDPDDAQSCCFVPDAERARLPDAAATATATSSGGNNNGRCRACGGGEASVLVLPCRHLCLCKACEPRWDACPVCLAAKNASIHGARQLGLDP